MRTWTRGERIGCASFLVGLATCVAVVLSLPDVQRRLRRSGDAAERAGASDTAAGGPTAVPGPGHDIARLELQRKLLEEQTLAARHELLRLHEERMALWKDRVRALEERHRHGERREFDRVHLRNACSARLHVVVYYRALDERWVTRGWWNVEPGQTVETDVATRNTPLYFYAESPTIRWTWSGSGSADAVELPIAEERFDQLAGERWVYPESRTVAFYPRATGDEWVEHVETFECPVEKEG